MAEPRRRILVVEDEYIIAVDLADALAESGIEVVGPVGNVARALAVIEVEPLDGAILDINLAGDAVYPVADALRARFIPFVFATGYDRSAIASGYETVPRCEKPVDGKRVADLLFRSIADR